MGNKKKLCLIYNFAPRYREGIFRLIDREYDCNWYFGDNATDIKGLDLSVLKHVEILQNRIVGRAPWYFQKGVLGLVRKKEYSTYFMLGDVYCLSTWFLAIVLKCFYPRKRLYFWSHGWYGKEGVVKRWLKKIFFKLVDGTFLYGNYAKDLMLKEGFRADRLFVIHNSLDYEQQLKLRGELRETGVFQRHFGNDCKNLIFIGRLTAVKRLDLLIEALRMLNDGGARYNLTLIGEGVQKEKLQELVVRYNLEGNVWFYGACYDDKVNAELIYNADLCVSPGNVGLTAMHVMVFGTPVATHDNFPYQMPEFEAIHEGRTGTFFKYDNVESMVDKIIEWLEVHFDREKVRQACYQEIDHSWTPQYQMKVIKEYLIIDG